jgi:4-amino-4-deoxy-L-arabinose transferase-like glycosyltransferase
MLNMLLDGAYGFIPWTTLLVPPWLAVRRQWRDAPFRFAFLAWIVPLVVVTLSQNHRARYLLPTYPAAALLVAWWCDGHGTERSRAVVVVTALTGLGTLVALIVLAVPWVDPMERELVNHFWLKAAGMAVGAMAVMAFACWMLLTQRPRALVGGLALGMAALLASGIQMYNGWVNRGQNYPALAALVERYAHGGDVGISGGRFLSIDFYLGRALTPLQTVAAFDQWLERPDRPLVVISGRAWRLMRGQARPDVEVLDTMRMRSHLMFLLGLTESPPSQAGAEPRPSRSGHPRPEPASRPPLQ